MNPGAFAVDGSFVIFRPLTRETEFSVVEPAGDQDAGNEVRVASRALICRHYRKV